MSSLIAGLIRVFSTIGGKNREITTGNQQKQEVHQEIIRNPWIADSFVSKNHQEVMPIYQFTSQKKPVESPSLPPGRGQADRTADVLQEGPRGLKPKRCQVEHSMIMVIFDARL